MPALRIERYPVGSASTSAATVPARMATGTGSPVRRSTLAVTYPLVPQNIAWPKERRPAYPNTRSKASANSPGEDVHREDGIDHPGQDEQDEQHADADDPPPRVHRASCRPNRPLGRDRSTSAMRMKISV